MANADDIRGLAQDMANAHKDRVKRIKGIKNETKEFVSTCQQEDKARASDVSKLKADADKLVKAIAGDNKKLEADVAKFIGECVKDDKTRANEISKLAANADKLVKEIAGDNKKLEADTQGMIKSFTKASKAQAAEVANLLSDYHKERVAAATAWKGLLSMMDTCRKEKASPSAKATARPKKRQLVGAGAGKKMSAKKGGKKRRKTG